MGCISFWRHVPAAPLPRLSPSPVICICCESVTLFISWFLMLLIGELFILRAGIGILKLHESTLAELEAGHIIKFLKRPNPGCTCPSELLRLIKDISISKNAYDVIMTRNQTPSSVRGLNQHNNHNMETTDKKNAEHNLDSCDSSMINILCPPFGVDWYYTHCVQGKTNSQ
jgi:hypothetical protein